MRFLPLVAMLLAGPALADDARDTFACLDQNAGTAKVRTECLGMITRYCQLDPEFRNAPGTVTCMEREALAWDGILEGQLSQLQAGLNDEEKALLKAAQLDWIRARDGECVFIESFFSRYSGSASAQWGAQCRRDRTAERAILLYDWAMRLEDF